MTDFASTGLIRQIVKDQKQGIPSGVYSICSANAHVIRAAMDETAADDSWLLVESTCNQVNQDGGYTGMKPLDFIRYIADLADLIKFPPGRILLGGDHLGPNPWKKLTADKAMEKSKVLVRLYVEAGYRKIHLDTTMSCADDPQDGPLELAVEAERTADLCSIAEETWQCFPETCAPVYVIGTEVPVPGGVENDEEGLQVTKPERVEKFLSVYREVFKARGLSDAFDRVIAMVVQPGVEFSVSNINEYNPEMARPLSQFIETVPGMIYEAHSTDYQLPGLLKKLVKDHFGILKVGPALTFAFREAVFALARIENELIDMINFDRLSHLIETVDRVMIANPGDWQTYYQGSGPEKAYARKYSFSDRIRYYWPQPEVENSLSRLLHNLEQTTIPLPLLSQYLPIQYNHIREGKIENKPEEILMDHIQEVIRDYRFACGL